MVSPLEVICARSSKPDEPMRRQRSLSGLLTISLVRELLKCRDRLERAKLAGRVEPRTVREPFAEASLKRLDRRIGSAASGLNCGFGEPRFAEAVWRAVIVQKSCQTVSTRCVAQTQGNDASEPHSGVRFSMPASERSSAAAVAFAPRRCAIHARWIVR
jgi:hypothetical protein